MSSENIYKRNNLYCIDKVKNHKRVHYGSFKDYDDAEFIRDLLVKYDWNIELISKLSPYFRFKDIWIILHVLNGKLYIMDKFKTKIEAQNNYMSSLKHFMRNPHDSKFGLYIQQHDNLFKIIKEINYINIRFGSFKNLKDAIFCRNLLIEENWDLTSISNLNPVQYDDENEEFCIIQVKNCNIFVLKRYKTYNEAFNKACDLFCQSDTDNQSINFNGKKFIVYDYVGGKSRNIASFKYINDAKVLTDILDNINWDLDKINSDEIYCSKGYFWKLKNDNSNIKIIGKYLSYEDALNNHNKLNHKKNHPYDKYIQNKYNKYGIFKRINGTLKCFGSFDSREDAVKKRDELIANNWPIEQEYYFSDENAYSIMVEKLTLWQKLIFDAFNSIDSKIVNYNQLKTHRIFKPFLFSKFEVKLNEHLNELVELNLINKISKNEYEKLW